MYALIAIPPPLVHLAAELVVFGALLIVENSADFSARFFLDGFESRLGLFAKVLKLVTGFLSDLVHLFPLRLIQSQIVVELIDIPLSALGAIGWIGVIG